MKLTDVRIRKTVREGKMRAVVSVAFDNEFALHDIRIIEGTEKLFIAMPSRKMPDGTYRDIAHPITSEFREMLEREIIARYEQELALEESAAPEEVPAE